MADFINQCYVCGKIVDPLNAEKNIQFNLPVCDVCKGSNREAEAIDQLLEGMADGFVCGCI